MKHGWLRWTIGLGILGLGAAALAGAREEKEQMSGGNPPVVVTKDAFEVPVSTTGDEICGVRFNVPWISSGLPLKSAIVGINGNARGVPVSFNLPVVANTLVPLGDGLHRVLWIEPWLGDVRGRVAIAREPSQALPPSVQMMAFLANGHELILNGNHDNASTMTVVNWGTDGSADVEWWPAQYRLQRKHLDPAMVKSAHLEIGSALQIGAVSLKVRGVEPQTAEHPQWVQFEVRVAAGDAGGAGRR
ncbi:MAG: hypothetical protein FWD17_00140 [Polyangiaceae bacterium]|nr:hypothetical protein [Polyangiaceae bacterium]